MRSSATSLRLAGAAILLLASAVPAMASDTTAPAPSDAAATSDTGAAPAAKPAEKPKEPKICRSEAASESRLGAKKVCLTKAEWRRRQD